MEIKRIVCLANSRKNSGRCIAGKQVLADGFGPWIRPVSARPSTEISDEERRYANGGSVKVLDVIDVLVTGAAPHHHQTENWVIHSGPWVKQGELSWAKVRQLLDKPSPLWTNDDSTYHGLNDRVKVDIASRCTDSLRLIAPEGLMLKVATEGVDFGNPRRKARADFRYAGAQYSLVVTDPAAERLLLGRPDGHYHIEDAYLCISLGEAHTDGSCYKLVASIIRRNAL